MDNLFIIFIVLIFLAFLLCHKKNKKSIIEGMQGTITDTQLASSVGLCYTNAFLTNKDVDPIWPSTEEECIGQTGYNLDFLDIDSKISALDNVLMNDTVESRSEKINSELTLSNNDIVQYQDNLYHYFGPDVSLNNDTGENMIKLFPYILTRGEEDKIEYCLASDGSGVNDKTEAVCEDSEDLWMNLINSPGYSNNLPDNYLRETDNCNNIDDINEVICANVNEIQVLHCHNQENNQIKPKEFFKGQYQIGSHTKIQELCEGERSDNVWVYQSLRNTYDDSQMIAQRLSSVPDSYSDPLNTQAITVFTELSNQERSQSEQRQELIERLREEANEMMNATCLFENSENKYHGNISKQTQGLYLCDGSSEGNSLEASTQAEACTPQSLSCDPNFATSSSDGLIKSIICNNGIFDYRGCQASQCTLPDGFHEKYEKIDGTALNTETGATFTVHDFKDTITGEVLIRCKNTHHGEPVVTSCQESSDGPGILQISGCEINQCHFEQTDMIGYTGIQTSGNNTIGGHHGDNPNRMCDTGFTSRTSINDLSDGQNNDELFRTNGITMSCPSNGESITLSGCSETICKNPAVSNKVHSYSDTFQANIDNKTDVAYIENDTYDKYVVPSNLPTGNIIPKNVLNGNMYCGKNYTRNGNSNSGSELANRLIPDDKIVCNSIYNVEASLNINNETINNHMPSFGDEITDKIGYINYLSNTLPNETHLDFSVEECNVNHCKWPTIQYDDNIINNYLLPPIRIDVPDGYGGDETSISPEELNKIQDTDGNRFKTGYIQSVSDDEVDVTLDKTSLQTAASWAGYNQENDSTRLKCAGEENTNCIVEPLFKNYEINEMINRDNSASNINDPLAFKGQDLSIIPDLETYQDKKKWSEYLESVKRGGPFEVSQCFNKTVTSDLEVLCNGENGQKCDDPNTSECKANIQGCQENMCRLSSEHAQTGTRLLVETIDNDGIIKYKTIGGINQENMELEFSVNQIRNITCDEGFSKPIGGRLEDDGILHDPIYGNLPEGDEVQNVPIKIKCENHGAEFTIENKCGMTRCPGTTIDVIEDKINLVGPNSGSLNTCPTNSIWKTQYQYHSNLDTPITSISDMNDIVTPNSEICSVIQTDDSIFDISKSRYSFSDGNITCSNDTNDPFITSSGNSQNIVEKCNYIPGEDVPKRTVSGCQPKLCKIPNNLSEGMIINPKLKEYPFIKQLFENNSEIVISMDFLDENYHNTDDISESYLSDDMKNSIDNVLLESPPRLNKMFLCDTGYHVQGGDNIEFSCNNDGDNISDFSISTSCEQNMCNIPSNFDNASYHVNTSLSSGIATVSDLQGSITCGGDFNLNTAITFKCDTHEGEFTIVDNNNPDDTDQDGIWNRLCQQNTCILPEYPLTDGDKTTFRNNEVVGDDSISQYLNEVRVPIDLQYCYNGLSNLTEPLQYSDYSQITCNPDCNGTASVTCQDSDQRLDVSGCSENYCVMPNDIYSGNNINYNFSNIINKLNRLQEHQSDLGGFTKKQFEKTWHDMGNTFECSPFSEPVGQGPVINCQGQGQTFTFETKNNDNEIINGCRPFTLNDERNFLAGSTAYSFYPNGCPLTKQNAFRYLSGTDNMYSNISSDERNDSGESVTHSLVRPDSGTESLSPLDETNDKFHYYYRYDPEPGPGASYLPAEGQNEEEMINNGWTKIPMYIDYTVLEPATKINKMEEFMRISQQAADLIPSAAGFNITKVNRITAEINAIDKCSRVESIDGDCRNQETGEVDTTKLATFLRNPENKFLQMGVFKSEQKGTNCIENQDILFTNGERTFFEDYGAVTDSGSNSSVYVPGGQFDVLNPDIVPDNGSVFMKQLFTGTTGNVGRQYTMYDDSELIGERPDPVPPEQPSEETDTTEPER